MVVGLRCVPPSMGTTQEREAEVSPRKLHQWTGRMGRFLVPLLLAASLPALASGNEGVAQEIPCSKVVTFEGRTHYYTNCATLDKQGEFSFAWTYNKTSGGMDFWFQGEPEIPFGWCGWGLSEEGGAVGASAVVGYTDPNDNQRAKASSYLITGFTASDIAVVPGSLNLDLKKLTVEYLNNGRDFRMKGSILVLKPEHRRIRMMWRGGQQVLDYELGTLGDHTNLSPASRLMDFERGIVGEVETTTSNKNWKIAHAWLAGLGMGVLMPVGALIARHLKVWADPAWYYTHIGVQVAGYLLGAIGWSIGIWLKTKFGNIQLAPGYHQDHYFIGVVAFCTATVQILTPIIKPHKGTPIRLYWNLGHWTLGYSTIALSITNCFLGFAMMANEFIDYGVWWVVYLVFICIVGGLWVLLGPVTEYKQYQNEKKKQEASLDKEGSARETRWNAQEANMVTYAEKMLEYAENMMAYGQNMMSYGKGMEAKRKGLDAYKRGMASFSKAKDGSLGSVASAEQDESELKAPIKESEPQPEDVKSSPKAVERNLLHVNSPDEPSTDIV